MQLVKNSFLSLVTHVSTRIANAVMFILIGRMSGVESAGAFQLAITYLLFFSVLTRGFDELVMRQVARLPHDTKRYFVTFSVLRALSNVLLNLTLIVFVRLVLGYTLDVSAVIMIVSLSLVPDGLIGAANAVLFGRRHFGVPALIAVSICVVRLVLGLALVSLGVGQTWVAVLWFLSSALGALASVILAALDVAAELGEFGFDRDLVGREFSSMIPFLVNGFLMAVEFQVDTILLSVLKNEKEVGWYGAATTVVFSLTMISQAYRMSVYPLMTQYAAESRHKLLRLYDSSVRYLGILALPMVAGITLLAPGIITLVFGPGFTSAVSVLRYLSPVLLALFLNVPHVRLMFVHNRQGWVTVILVGSMLVNIVLNIWLTPVLGARGAAIARTCSSLFFFVVNFMIVKFVVAKIEGTVLRLLWRPALATGVMSVVVGVLGDVPVVIVVSIGVVLYLSALFGIGGIPKEDLALALRFVQRRFRSA